MRPPDIRTPTGFLRLIQLLTAGALVILSGCDTGPATDATGPTQAEIIGPETGSVAIIEGVVIDSGRFNKIYQATIDRGLSGERALPPPIAMRTKMAIAQRMIDSELLLLHAKNSGLSLSRDELDQGIAEFAATFPSQMAYQRFVERQPLAEESIERIVRDRILSRKLIELQDADEITDAEARQYFEKNQARFNIPPHLLVREIVVSDEATARTVETAIAAGELEFAQIARLHSQARTARLGGNRGRTTAANIDAAVWSALQEMANGDSYGPVATDSGIFFVQRLGSNPGGAENFDAVKDKIKRSIAIRRHATEYAALIHRLREETDVRNHVADRYGRLLSTTRLQQGQPPLGSGHVVTGELEKKGPSGSGGGNQ